MAMNCASNLNNRSVMGFYFSFTKACYFAGLFCYGKNTPLSDE